MSGWFRDDATAGFLRSLAEGLLSVCTIRMRACSALVLTSQSCDNAWRLVAASDALADGPDRFGVFQGVGGELEADRYVSIREIHYQLVKVPVTDENKP